MGLLISWALLTIVVFVTAAVVPGFKIRGFTGAVLVAALFGILNFVLGWLLFVVIGVGTLGLGFLLAFVTRWLVDAILLSIVDTLSASLEIESFGRAFLAAMVMSGLGTLLEFLLVRM